MAVFSNLEGTLKKKFILGKNGAQFTTNGDIVQIQDYSGTRLLPVSAGDPTANTHLVTLAYFNAHGGSGASGILRGDIAPADTLGTDGDVYFMVDATNIVQIYIKDLGIWKPFNGGGPVTDSPYVTSFSVPVAAFVLIPGTVDEYTYTIPESQHDRGRDILVQMEDTPTDGNPNIRSVVNSEITLSGFGDITIKMLGLPDGITEVKVNIIGATAMTTPYGKLINKADWIAAADKFTYTVTADTHKQSPDSLYVAIYGNDVPGSTASAPFDLVFVDTQIDTDGNVTFVSDEQFSGKIVIAGK
ncbi:hypothetical protein ABV23_RS01885 [Escherichia coli]